MNILGSRHVFRALAWGMVTMGIAMGAVFPIMAVQMGVTAKLAYSPAFIGITLAAGLIVGGLNFLMAKKIVRPRLVQLTARMRKVRNAMEQATFTGDWSACDPNVCRLEEQAEDELGDVANSYNALLQALHQSHLVEMRIQNFNNTLSSQLDLGDLCEQALTLLLEHARADGGVIILERQGELTIPTAISLINAEALLQSPALKAAQEQAETKHITLPENVKVDAVLAHFTPRDVLMVPIKHHGILLGWVVLAASAPLDDNAARLLPLLIQGLGLALNNALLHADLQRVAALDPLTAIYNRRFGMKRLEEELARTQRNKTPLALMILDLDHFKRVNDTYGHLVGDKVLLRAAAICREVLRKGDILMRYGGEEFIAILPGSDVEDARQVGERIRFAIRQSRIELTGVELQVTVSIGVACTNGSAQSHTPESLIKVADQRLYAAKASGRDRVMIEAHPGAAEQVSD